MLLQYERGEPIKQRASHSNSVVLVGVQLARLLNRTIIYNQRMYDYFVLGLDKRGQVLIVVYNVQSIGLAGKWIPILQREEHARDCDRPYKNNIFLLGVLERGASVLIYIFSFEYGVELAVECDVEGEHAHLFIHDEFRIHVVGVRFKLLSNCIYNTAHAVGAVQSLVRELFSPPTRMLDFNRTVDLEYVLHLQDVKNGQYK